MSKLGSICLNEFVKELIINSTNKPAPQEIKFEPLVSEPKIELETTQKEISKIENLETTNEKNNSMANDMIDMLNQDRRVEKIECPGPEKPFLILKDSEIKPIAFSLSKSEIDEIIEDISKQTNTPLNSGILTTTFENWNFVGIISEFGGSRFIIQKPSKLDKSV